MNSSDHQKTGTTPGTVVSFVWSLCITALGGAVAVAVLLAVFFPGKNGPLQLIAMKAGLVPAAPGMTSHVPKGQLQADARTFMASLRWLLQPDWDSPMTTSNRTVTTMAYTNAPAIS